MRDNDEYGQEDDHCLSCGARRPARFTAAQLDSIALHLTKSSRVGGYRRGSKITAI